MNNNDAFQLLCRKKLLDELGILLNHRISKMEILDSKNPSSFRKGIIEAYRDIEMWERQEQLKIRRQIEAK